MSFADQNSELHHAYIRTTYSAATPFGIVRIRIGNAVPLLDDLLKGEPMQEWAFVSACNPGSQRISDEENNSRHRQLCALLAEKGYRFFEGHGAGDDPAWDPEQSVLVIGIPHDEALEIARHFRQNAIVCGALGELPRIMFLSEFRS